MGNCATSRTSENSGYAAAAGSTPNSYQVSEFIQSCAKKNFSAKLRYNDSDFIAMAYNGELLTLVAAIGKDEIPELLSVRGFEYNLAHANFSTTTKKGGSSVNSFNADNIEMECPRVKR